MCTINGMTFRAPLCILDVVLDGCTIYKLWSETKERGKILSSESLVNLENKEANQRTKRTAFFF